MSKVIKLGNYKGIEAEVTKQPVADTEVDNEIQRLVAQSTSLIEKDGDVTNGDVTTIDFEGFKNNTLRYHVIIAFIILFNFFTMNFFYFHKEYLIC